jgi:hypothetical protein
MLPLYEAPLVAAVHDLVAELVERDQGDLDAAASLGKVVSAQAAGNDAAGERLPIVPEAGLHAIGPARQLELEPETPPGGLACSRMLAATFATASTRLGSLGRCARTSSLSFSRRQPRNRLTLRR